MMSVSGQGNHVSVIIPVWNGGAYLRPCLDALLAQTYQGFEIIAVDNGSTDGGPDMIASSYPAVRLIRNHSNRGFSGACNAGLRISRGQLLVLLNQDTCVRRGWLAALVGAFRCPRVGVVGCKILYPGGSTIQHAGSWIEWPLGLAHHHGQGERDAGDWDEPRQVEYVTGAALAFRRELLDRVGLLDEGFWPGYFEDADYCFRAREAGYEIWYSPSAVLTHEETTSLQDAVPLARAYQRGRLRFLLKHLPPQRFLDELVPVERAYQCELGTGHAGNLLRTSYLEAMVAAASLLPRRWSADRDTVDEVLSALLGLFRSQHQDSTSLMPSLREFEFASSVPMVGPLLARIRSLWFGVAARWAIRHLIQQQEAINQQQDVYAQSIASISREIAHLVLETRGDRASGTIEGNADEG